MSLDDDQSSEITAVRPDVREQGQPPSRGGIVLLTSHGALANMVINALSAAFGPITVIREQPESKKTIIRRRMRLNGTLAAVGQVVLGLGLRAAAFRFKPRWREIWANEGLDPSPNRTCRIITVNSHNSAAARAHLSALAPDVVAVYGTRILSSATLGATPAPFVNYHAGINPKYRGQHPAYWARAANDDANAGVTIHLVDEGVDTGDVLYQRAVTFAPSDNIATYQHVQMAVALPLFARALKDGLAGNMSPRKVDLPSQKFFPPTLWGYLQIGFQRGVW